jgi:tetratricopeptide (TPR) repeat protein
MGLEPDATLDLPRAMEAAERFGAGAVLGATISRAGADYILSGRALDPRSGAAFFAVRTTAPDDRLLGAVEELAREMRARLGEDPRALARSLPLPEVTTSSIEALRLYAEAERQLPVDAERAGALANAAIEADSTFAMAHRLAAAASSGLLRFGETARHMERAYQFRDRLPERERWHVEAIHASNVAYDPGRAEEVFQLIVQRYPDDWRAWHNMGVTRQGWLGDHEGAYEAFRHALALDSTNLGGLSNALQIAYIAGHPDEAVRLAEAAEGLGAIGSVVRWQALRSFAEGDPLAAVEACDRLLELDARGLPTAADAEICGSIDLALGRHHPGERRLTDVRDRYLEQDRHRNATHAAQALALSRFVQGDTAGAARHLTWVLDQVPADRLPGTDGFIVRTNLTVQAHLLGLDEVARRAHETYPPFPDADHWFARHGRALVEAASAVGAGAGDRALEVLEAPRVRTHHPIGWRIWDELVRGLAHELAGNPEAAARHFEAAGDPRFHTLPFATKDRVHRLLLPSGRPH